ncbi:conserved hypothetical protein [Histoplasma capsulatum G186AR]|uniref:Subtelomeric hrmA-associated cluster protein AFUB-079030/YDR124W-like helical bundle domain-containing protein n=2 Tax=Ajellomyces capsulatus TaxID=5037 RepID=C0NDY8_AJECG|nr:uncharacterized protein HCBG_02081 [Histoplasma capsulatum G186AR]EEH10436.1 conserved hypothetical protein [Histoplasma capsulatum G186AR]KAG5290583.1 DUF2841 superfamily domain-containing protein [Histoplasma capsulatum]QSS72511.1 DUF2841 superfamily domain-containing protein [Histoplasma capsulatum G186AR]
MVARPVASVPSGPHLKPRNNESMEGIQSWESSSDVFTVESRSAIHIPYRHYALAYLDVSGNVRYELSPSMLDHKSEIFLQDFEERFFQHASQSMFPGQLNTNPTRNPRARRPRYLSSYKNMPAQKRQRLEYTVNAVSEEEDDEFEDQPVNNIGLPIGDEEKMLAYYAEAFRAFQQINCRQVAKAYIKLIEPRKQAKHPYNGGKAGPGEIRDPEKTKPEWWPTDVIHKEPDHLKKIPRVKLLIHIFRNLSKSHGITARKLKAAGEEAQKQCRPPEKASILDEIYRVREEEERYERGEIDADTLVYVVKREKMNRGIREDSETASDSEQQQGYVPELASLNEQQSSVKMTPHVLPMHNRVVPTFDLGENRNTLFSTTISAPFESATPNPLSPMGIKSDYEKFTPMGSPISIDDRPTTSNINYLQGLPQSPIEGQYMNPRSSVPENQTAGNYGPWPTPSFQHPIFNQVDYGNGNSGVIPQHFMSPMMPTPSHAPLPLQGARSQLPMDRTPIFPAFRDDT